MKRSWMVCLFVLTWGVPWILCDENAPRIAELREKQWSAGYTDYIACEHEIARIKHDNNVWQDDPWFAIASYVHAIPWLVWQILAVLLACTCGLLIPYAWSGRYIITTLCVVLLCGIATYVSWWGYRYQASSCGVICQQSVPMRIGPSHAYPVIKHIPYIHEVEIVQRLEEWSKVRYTNTHGWIANANIVYINRCGYS